MKKHLQIPIKCHCVTKKSSKRWLDLSSKTLIFLNFRKLYTSFEICNQKVYSKDPIKRAARLTIFQVFFLSIALNRACSLNYFQEIFSPARLICPARLTIIHF